jgi:hypothetical protein
MRRGGIVLPLGKGREEEMTRTIYLGALAAGALMAAGVLLLIIVALVEPAGAACPSQNGKIAFDSTRHGNSEIYTMNPNGTALDRLTNHTASDSEPAWSPDGNRIVFVSTRHGNNEIYAMNPNGQALKRLTNNPHLPSAREGDSSPDWQPLSAAPPPD